MKGNLRNKEEVIRTVVPGDDIQCVTCALRSDGTVWSNEPQKANCMKYRRPSHKPVGILFGKEKCEFYQKE